MKISFLADIDYANVLTEYAHLLNESPDIECKSICLKKHIFDYDLQHDYDLLGCNPTQIKEVIDYMKLPLNEICISDTCGTLTEERLSEILTILLYLMQINGIPIQKLSNYSRNSEKQIF